MQFDAHRYYTVQDRSHISSAKKEISKLAESQGFDEGLVGRIDIIISEMSSNLVKHNTTSGEILVKFIYKNKIPGIEILSLDNGPGMSDTHRMLQDGVSTYGSKGEGLGAIRRLSDEFDIYSQAGIGTVILSRLFMKSASETQAPKPPKPKLVFNAIMVPKKGETLAGDGWFVAEKDKKLFILTLDGLGHGPDAHMAAQAAIQSFSMCKGMLPSLHLRHIHESIKKTRGCVGTVMRIDPKEKDVKYCGIGNISGRMFWTERSKSLISYNGTLGHNIPNSFNDQSIVLDERCMIVFHSDGIKSRWEITKYPDLHKHDCSVVAGVLYKDNNRGTDDSLVVVVKYNYPYDERRDC